MSDDIKVDTHGTQSRIFDSTPALVTGHVEEQLCILNETGTSNNVTKPVMESVIFKEVLPTKKNEMPVRNAMVPLKKIPVRCLKGHYCRTNAILLGTPKSTITSASAWESLLVVYEFFGAMDPDLTFKPSKKELRCQGYYTHDFDTCSFITQIHRVHPLLAATDESTEYICELRRTSINGRESFN